MRRVVMTDADSGEIIGILKEKRGEALLASRRAIGIEAGVERQRAQRFHDLMGVMMNGETF